jgi:hypothetical protein
MSADESAEPEDNAQQPRDDDTCRVVIACLGPLLRGLIRGLLDTVPSVEIISEVDDPDLLVDVVCRADADAVVAASDLDALWPELLRACPAVTVLSITADDGSGELVELSPISRSFGELSLEVLASALRSARSWEERFR